MFEPLDLSVKEIRLEMGLSQSQLADAVGISKRAIQSYEQGWRQPSEMAERMMLLLLIAYRNGAELAHRQCWNHKACPPDIRNECSAYLTRQGHLCWLLTGVMCDGKRRKSWDDKLQACFACSFMHGLLHPSKNDAERIDI